MNTRGMKAMCGKVFGVAITGNEDGGHHVSAEMFQGLDDLGFTPLPESRASSTGWTDDAPNANYRTHGRDNAMTRYMIEHRARNLMVFGPAFKALEPDIPTLASDDEAAKEEAKGAKEKAGQAHV